MKDKYFIELTVTLPPGLLPTEAETLRDLITYDLGERGFSMFLTETDGALRAYIPEEDYPAGSLRELLDSRCDGAAFSVERIADRDWNEEWEKNYHSPVEIVPGKVLVRASFHPARPEVPYEIIIDPRMAFGTGNHDTTAGMLRLIDECDLRGAEVIDMGCGSGILGIFALKKGAAAVHALDIDPWAVDNASDNAAANGVTLEVRAGDASLLPSLPRVKLFLANITRNIILQDLPSYLDRLLPGGTLLLSGFLAPDLPLVEEALRRDGRCSVVRTVVSDAGWAALRADSAEGGNGDHNTHPN